MEKSELNRKGKNLGKGLNSLLGLDSASAVTNKQSDVTNVIDLPVNQIRPNPRQPRKFFRESELEELASSLREDGVVQPLIVSKLDEGGYCLIAGERRWRASIMAGFKTVPVLIKNVTPDEMLRIAIIENVQRSNLTVLEEAEAYNSLIKDFGLTQDECAKKVGKERSTVSNLLRLLSLPKELHQDLMDGLLTMGHGRALLSLGDKDEIVKARNIIVRKELNVRQTEQLIKRLKNHEAGLDNSKNNADLEYLAESLRGFLRTKVKVAGNGSRGKIEISYFSPAELERLLEVIGGEQFQG